MSLKILPIPPVPEDTARVVRACFPHGTLVVQVRDALGTLYSDEDFADLFPTRGQPAAAPWRLAFVTVLQFLEDLPDRQAADAVRSRLDWKYALSLELTDPGFDHTVLSEFRTRLVAGGAEERLLDLVVEQARARGWIKPRGTQRTDSTPVLAAHRLDACARSGAGAHATGMRGGDAASCAQCPGGGRTRVAAPAPAPAAGVGRALCPPRRGVSPAERQSRARAVCQPGGHGWLAVAGRPGRGRHPGLAA